MVVAVQKLMESYPKCALAQESLEVSSQELLEKEVKNLEWKIIRVSRRWAQLDGRMDVVFFEGMREAHSTIPIQLLIGSNSTNYSTNEELASHANSYYKALFTLDGMTEECEATRHHCWNKVSSRSWIG